MDFFKEANCNINNNPDLGDLCAHLGVSHPTQLMYPKFINGSLVETDVLREAAGKALCAECPVKDQCLEHALANHENFGTWGGYNEKELRRLKRHIFR